MPSWIEILNERNSSEIFFTLITITHPDLSTPVYLADVPVLDLPIAGVKGIVSNGQEYVYLPFSLALPNLEASGTIPAAKFSCDNISREILAVLSTISSAPKMQIQVGVISAPNAIQYNLTGLTLANITYNELTIDADITTEYFFGEPYPGVTFTPSRFPGVFRGRSVNKSV